MVKHIFILTILLLGCNRVEYNNNQEVIIKYYYNLGDSINYYNFKSKHQYSKSIDSIKALKVITSLTKINTIEPDMAVYKVYFKNKYLQNIPFKAEKYNGRKTPSKEYFYDNKGRLKKSYLITDRGTRYITNYFYDTQKMISETIFTNGSKEKTIYKYKNNILYKVAEFYNDKLQDIYFFVLKKGRLIEVKREPM